MAHYYNPRSQILSHLSFRLPTDKMAVEIQRTRGYRSKTSKLPSSSDIHSLTVKASSAGTKRNSSKLRASSQTFIPSDSTLARLGKVTSSSTAPTKISIVSRTNTSDFSDFNFFKAKSRPQSDTPLPKGIVLETMVEVLLKLDNEPDAFDKYTLRRDNLFAFRPRPCVYDPSIDGLGRWVQETSEILMWT